MKKVLKSRIFAFLLGGLLFGTVSVVAVKLIATNITYKNTTVGAALDDLYTKATTYTKLETETSITSNKILSGNSAYNSNGELVNGSIATYTPSVVTPSKTEQILEANGKYINGNITINAIPSTYKNLTTNTTVEASNLLSGYTAYNKNGTLVTGSMSPTCVKTSFICDDGCVTSSGHVLNGVNFKPVTFEIYGTGPNGAKALGTYNTYTNSTTAIGYDTINGDISSSANHSYVEAINSVYPYINNHLVIKNFGEYYRNWQLTVIACK